MTELDGGNTGPANSGGQPTVVPMFTQEQVNHFQAEAKRNALGNYFKELGLDAPLSAEDLQTKLSQAEELANIRKGEQTEVQRLTGELDAAKQTAAEVPGLRNSLRIAQLAADAGLKSRYWKFVEGKSDEEINASIKEVLADFNQGTTDSGQGGSGPRRPAPVQQQGTGGGAPPQKSTMQAGVEAYKAKRGTK